MQFPTGEGWYSDLEPAQLHAHLQYLGNALPEKSRILIEMGPDGLQIPAFKREYKRKPATVSLLIRTSSVGREALENLTELLISESFDVRLRRSVKKKYLSQCTVVLPVNDSTFPLKAVSILRMICSEAEMHWPPSFAVGYPPRVPLDGELPGALSYNSPAWYAGFRIGWLLGSLLRVLRAPLRWKP